MRNPHEVTKDLEEALCEYTGAKYAVAVNSCTMALELALLYCFSKYSWSDHFDGKILLPKRTYVSVPQAVIRAGFKPIYEDRKWGGEYRLNPFDIWDSAKRFTSGMYKGGYRCVSFHVAKIFGDTQGGAILHNNPEADKFFRAARFDGRDPNIHLREDRISLPARFTRHCYMSPDVAVRLLNHFQYLPKHNDDQEEVYADISYIE